MEIKTTSATEENLNAALIAQTFCSNTTSHGLAKITQSTGVVKRVLWILLNLAALVMLTYQLYTIIDSYLQLQKTTSTRRDTHSSLRFPAVTICNNNMIKKSVLHTQPLLQSRVKTFRGLTSTQPLLDYIHTTFTEINPELQYALGHQLNDTILLCEFNGQQCLSTFTQYYHMFYGNCFMFNGPTANISVLTADLNDTELKTRRPGHKYGLTMVLNIEQYDYIPILAQASGARIVIHDPDNMPFPEEESLGVAPNTLVDISLRQVNYVRLKEPYSHCAEKDSTIRNAYKDVFSVRYSKLSCLKTCLQAEIIKRCECFSPEIIYNSTSFEYLDTQPAGPCSQSAEHGRCDSETQYLFSSGEVKCSECYDACRETQYDWRTTTTKWPSPSFASELLYFMEQKHPERRFNSSDSNNVGTALEENLLKVNIFFESMVGTTIEEQPSYDPAQFFSNLGGSLGLYVGWSFLTIFEFFEFIFDIVWHFILSKSAKSQDRITPIK